ncbi:acylneuraminate cytidylyltransferase family protein [Hephaestia mangrovi]|uniref:acylneuraminate cytidylyltransferase family protein n=1 Tax=Hephaestia mangrovi TaxID=2873268 RepID=UPI001CA646ED|nr:acylneuraminate cytidylyltransferase family protein [Hephaestia mangrovi]MBY8829928.1 acylneuraminate cytidylyltransferase family protein [Hephaestia mangrovi]
MTEVLALVPARAGSKGLPGKNVRLLGGHPLIAWSVLAARSSSAVTRVICTTDSSEIAAVARTYGAETPFLRPAQIAGDDATDFMVFDHALKWLKENENYRPDIVVQLRPTTPFRGVGWISEAIARMVADSDISCIRTVTVAEKTPYKMWRLTPGNILKPLLEMSGIAEPFNMPRQALPEVYWHTGQLDVIRVNTILSGSMTGRRIIGFSVASESAVDIDTIDDFTIAEVKFAENMPLQLVTMADIAVNKS